MANGFRKRLAGLLRACHKARMFRRLTDHVWVAPQIAVGDVAEAARLGVATIVNNRPEGESADQTPGAEIEAAAQAAGLAYTAIPVTHAGFSRPQVSAMAQALAGDGSVLAYCRSGTRSTLLWALAEASKGADPDDLAETAAAAGYDLSPVMEIMRVLAAQ